MPDPKLERIIVKNKTIWRVSYLGMVKDFDSDWAATGFLHDLWLSHKAKSDLTQQ